MDKNFPYDLTISIVNYNTFSFLENCLESIYANTRSLTLQVIVIDNASREAEIHLHTLRACFPGLQIIANHVNRYFTGGHNQSLAKCRGKYFLILNPDTVVLPRTLETLFGYMEQHTDVGAVTCKELNERGETVVTCTRFPTPFINILEWTRLRDGFLHTFMDGYLMADWQRDTPRQVDVATGCFLFTRADILDQFGGFDEGIRLYFSEHDLCMQLARLGYRIFFLPDGTYLHHGQKSSVQENPGTIRQILFEDMRYYFAKYFSPGKAAWMMRAIYAGRSIERTIKKLSPMRVIGYTKRRMTGAPDSSVQ